MAKPMTSDRMWLNIGVLIVLCGAGFVFTVDWALSVSPTTTMGMWAGAWGVLLLIGTYWAYSQHQAYKKSQGST